jgi:MoxR-like ATPase
LEAAVKVALMLGQPLLLTGEPGTGKTTLAYWVAHKGFGGRPLNMPVKSTTSRTDLLYRIDELRRFRDAQYAQKEHPVKPMIEYVEFQPLGEAILRCCGPDVTLRDRADRRDLQENDPLVNLDEVFGPERPEGPPTTALLLPRDKNWKEPQRYVVLIDEIDKAPRDTPNDLLEEFERFSFAIPELGLRVTPPEGTPRPVVIVTSNSEKSLPDAFLRRCTFHNIAFPDEKTLRRIIESRLGGGVFSDERQLDRLLALFEALRKDRRMRKPPGTFELLSLLRLLKDNPDITRTTDLRGHVAELKGLLGAVVKSLEDTETAEKIVNTWATTP